MQADEPVCNLEELCAVAGVHAAPCECDSKCQSYVLCDHGTGVLGTCPFFLRLNPALMNCDWPSNVPCTC